MRHPPRAEQRIPDDDDAGNGDIDQDHRVIRFGSLLEVNRMIATRTTTFSKISKKHSNAVAPPDADLARIAPFAVRSVLALVAIGGNVILHKLQMNFESYRLSSIGPQVTLRFAS